MKVLVSGLRENLSVQPLVNSRRMIWCSSLWDSRWEMFLFWFLVMCDVEKPLTYGTQAANPPLSSCSNDSWISLFVQNCASVTDSRCDKNGPCSPVAPRGLVKRQTVVYWVVLKPILSTKDVCLFLVGWGVSSVKCLFRKCVRSVFVLISSHSLRLKQT